MEAMKKKGMEGWLSEKLNLTPIEAEICASAIMVVIFGALLLLTLNWDNKAYAFFLSMAFCGAVISFVSVGALLKEENIEELFLVSLPFNMKTGNLPLIVPDISLDAEHPLLLSRLTELSSLASRLGLKSKWGKVKVRGTEKDPDIFRYCGELLQYYIFRVLYRIQDKAWFSSQLAKKTNKGVDHAASLMKMTEYQGGHIIKFVSTNRFAQPPSEQAFWEGARIQLPEGTTVTLGEIAPLNGLPYGGHKLRLVKTGFFEIGFSALLVSATPRGVLQPGLHFYDEERVSIRTFQYTIQMSAHFNRLTAGNQQTPELKRWVRGLFRTIHESLSDGMVPDSESALPVPKQTEQPVMEEETQVVEQVSN